MDSVVRSAVAGAVVTLQESKHAGHGHWPIVTGIAQAAIMVVFVMLESIIVVQTVLVEWSVSC